MKTDIQDTSPTRKVITASFTAEEVDAETSELFAAYKKSARLPGFRPGKAPDAMIRQRYKKEIEGDLKQRIISKAHKEAVQDGDFTVVSMVEMDEGEINAGAPASVTFTVDVLADFEIPDYNSVKVDEVDATVNDSEVDDAIERIRSQRADYKEVERSAEKGDYVRCSYTGTLDDQPVAELAPDQPVYGTQTSTWEEAGAEEAPGVQAVIQGLLGMKAGDEKTVTETFPEDFKVPALAGKSVDYKITVDEVRERILPELDEEFLKSLQVESLEKLKELILNDLKSSKERDSRAKERQAVIDQLLAAVDFPVAESALESETQTILRDFMQENARRGATEADFEKNKDSLFAAASASAVTRLKSRILLLKIADKEKIRVENRDLSHAAMMEAQRRRITENQIVQELKKDRQKLQNLQRDVLIGKTLDFLHQKARGIDASAPAAADTPAESAE